MAISRVLKKKIDIVSLLFYLSIPGWAFNLTTKNTFQNRKLRCLELEVMAGWIVTDGLVGVNWLGLECVD